MPVEASKAKPSGTRELMSALVSSAVSRLGALVVGLAINAILARALTKSEYAAFGVILSLGAIFTVFVQMGYQTSIVRFAGESVYDRTPLAPDLWAGTIASFLGGIVIAVAAVFLGNLVLPDVDGAHLSQHILLLIGIFIVAMGLNIFLGEAIRGLGFVGSASSLTGMGQHGGVLRAVLFLGAIFAIGGPHVLDMERLLWLSIGASLAMSTVCYVYIGRRISLRARPGDIWSTVKRHWRLNIHMMFGQILQLLASQHAVLVVGGAILTGPSLALLVAAQQLRYILTAPMTLFNGASPKVMIQASRQGDKRELQHLMRIGASMATIFVVAASFVLIAAGPWMFGMLFGNGYRGAYLYYLLLLPGLFFNAFGGTAARVLVLLGFERSFMWFSIIVSIISIPLYVGAAYLFGAVGLALSSSIMLTAQNFVLVMMVRRYIGLWSTPYLDPRRLMTLYRSRFGRRRLIEPVLGLDP